VVFGHADHFIAYHVHNRSSAMDREIKFWGGFTLRECLVLGFTASLVVITEMLVRIPLHLPGHRVLPLAFFLLLGRSAVRHGWAATSIGLLTAAGCLALGREGLDHLMKYVAAGVITDAAAFALPAVLTSSLLGAVTGALIGASWLPVSLVVDRLAGMDTGAAWQHTLLKLGSAMLFGAAGGLLAPAVSGRLRRSGLVPGPVTMPVRAAAAHGGRFAQPPAG
jgi:hypothetical protein